MNSEESIRAAEILWQTNWLIIGPRLPYAEVMPRTNIYLAPLHGHTPERSKLATTPVIDIDIPSEHYVIHYPPREVIESRHRLQVDVTASCENNAVNCAKLIVEKILVSFSLLVPGGRYRAELRKIRQAYEKSEYTSWSHPIKFTQMRQPEPLDQDDLEKIFKLFDKINIDNTAQNAYDHLFTAWKLQEMLGLRPLQRSVLLHYVLCIETIISGLMREIRRERSDQIRTREREFARNFAHELIERANKADAIREASTKLRNIGLINMLPAIETVAPILGLSNDQMSSAKDLYRFRSRTVGHPGTVDPKEMDHWLKPGSTIDTFCKADATARVFLAGYCLLKST